MRWSKSLIMASIFSYVAAAATAILGYPPIDPAFIPPLIQAMFYALMGIALLLQFRVRQLKPAVMILYGLAAMLSFSGLEPWINYAGSNVALGPAMALWDLALAVAVMEEY